MKQLNKLKVAITIGIALLIIIAIVAVVLKFNNNTYRIDKKIDWIDYKIYSLIGCDINVG